MFNDGEKRFLLTLLDHATFKVGGSRDMVIAESIAKKLVEDMKGKQDGGNKQK